MLHPPEEFDSAHKIQLCACSRNEQNGQLAILQQEREQQLSLSPYCELFFKKVNFKVIQDDGECDCARV